MTYTFLYDEQRATFLRGNGRGKTLKKCKVLMCFETLLKICRKDGFDRGNKKNLKYISRKCCMVYVNVSKPFVGTRILLEVV